MSKPNKLDIADYFRPHAKTIPPQRRTPHSNDDHGGGDGKLGTPQTPTSKRSLSQIETSQPPLSRSLNQPLQSPRSDRSISIPIRSPDNQPPSTALTASSNSKPIFFYSTFNNHALPTTATPSTFSSAHFAEPSRKVIEHGELIAVRDSDDSDNESLESLTDIFSPKKGNIKSDLDSTQQDDVADQEKERRHLLAMFTGRRSEPILDKAKVRELQRLEHANKFDLTHILREDRMEEQARARIAQIQAEIDASAKELDASRQEDLDKSSLAAIINGGCTDDLDREDLSRLLSAVDRTEALSGEKAFSFFGRTGIRDPRTSRKTPTAYPPGAIPHALCHPKDSAARDRLYLSGFMKVLAAQDKLTDTAIRWMFNSVLLEERHHLRQSYVDCITASSHTWTRANLAPEDIQAVWDMLGADPNALQDGTEIQPQPQFGNQFQKSDYKHLIIALSLFSSVCQDMDFVSLSKLCSTVCRLALDEKLMRDNQVFLVTGDLLQKLADLPDTSSRQHVHERLLSDLGTNLKDPALQALFLQTFITTTPSAAKLRSQLAATFLLGSNGPRDLAQSNSSQHPLSIIFDYLSMSPYFTTLRPKSKLSNPTSYATLTALTIILDATVADGYAKLVFVSRAEEQEFNGLVDNIANHIHELFASIADTGASHMRRTEAKETLQAFHHRLLFGMRTRVRRKRHVFDAKKSPDGRSKKTVITDIFEAEEEVRGKDFMSKFFKKAKRNDSPRLDEMNEFVDAMNS